MGQARDALGGSFEQFTVLGNETCVCFQDGVLTRRTKEHTRVRVANNQFEEFLDRADQVREADLQVWDALDRLQAEEGGFRDRSRAHFPPEAPDRLGRDGNAPTVSPSGSSLDDAFANVPTARASIRRNAYDHAALRRGWPPRRIAHYQRSGKYAAGELRLGSRSCLRAAAPQNAVRQ